MLAVAGMDLTADAARRLERQVVAKPDAVTARIKLLGYYMSHGLMSAEARTARQKHVLWLICNRPENSIHNSGFVNLNTVLDGSAYDAGKKAWLDLVNRRPNAPTILGHAAAYLLLNDGSIAEKLYLRAEAAGPHNHEWPARLGQLYQLGLSSKTGEAMKKAAKAALDAYERSLSKMKGDMDRESLLGDVAKAALEAGDIGKARTYAEEMLRRVGDSSQGHWNYGNLIHHGHLVLGRIALREGKLDQAKQHLHAAGETPGSPQLDSFGPNMTLAKELLEKGERNAVLEYFKQCGRFWKLHSDYLDSWAKEVREGKVPDFGANLDY